MSRVLFTWPWSRQFWVYWRIEESNLLSVLTLEWEKYSVRGYLGAENKGIDCFYPFKCSRKQWNRLTMSSHCLSHSLGTFCSTPYFLLSWDHFPDTVFRVNQKSAHENLTIMHCFMRLITGVWIYVRFRRKDLLYRLLFSDRFSWASVCKVNTNSNTFKLTCLPCNCLDELNEEMANIFMEEMSNFLYVPPFFFVFIF
jgi:hypothetical protein